jgi:hypothetical protein
MINNREGKKKGHPPMLCMNKTKEKIKGEKRKKKKKNQPTNHYASCSPVPTFPSSTKLQLRQL